MSKRSVSSVDLLIEQNKELRAALEKLVKALSDKYGEWIGARHIREHQVMPAFDEAKRALKTPTVVARDIASRLPPRAREIVSEVLARHGVPLAEVFGRRSSRQYVHIQQEIYWRLRRLDPPYSYGRIGQMFDRDHTTVMHHSREYEARRAALEAANEEAA